MAVQPTWSEDQMDTARGDQRMNEGGQPKKSMGGLANALGWFSIGLGLAQVAAPGSVARLIGVREDGDNRRVLQAVGAREIVSGIGILTQRQATGWLWARVGGDIMDLMLLNRILNSNESRRDRVGTATAAVVGVTLLDLLSSQQSRRQNGETNGQQNGGITAKLPWNKTIHVQKAITINRPPEEVYQFWHNFQNLPRFMKHLESVQVMGDSRSHWRAKAPAGMTVEWDAEMINDQPNQLIAWRSVEGADVDNSGMVQFIPASGGRGTEVHVQIHYNPPGGVIGAAFAKLFGEAPDQQMQDDLRRFKQVMETGEVVQSDASIHSHPHPAQPSAEPVMDMSNQATELAQPQFSRP